MNDLRRRLLFLLGALIVFRVGAHIPVPGVNAAALANSFKEGNAGILGMLNLFSGGSLERFSIFAIGIMPYISASIIIQLVAEVLPSLKALKKEGEAGRRTLTKYTRWGTLLVAVVQAFAAAAVVYQRPDLVVIGRTEFYISTITCLVTGTMFLMWLGEQMTERGIGNGISMLIFAGIAVHIPSGIVNLIVQAKEGDITFFRFFLMLLIIIALFAFIVFIERAQRQIAIHYAKRQGLGSLGMGKRSHLPLKINMAGVIPAIFASAIITLIVSGLALLGGMSGAMGRYFSDMAHGFSQGNWLYVATFSLLIVLFSFFYTAMMFENRELADNLKKSNAFIQGFRPGRQTSEYLDMVQERLTLVGALYVAFVCVLPSLLNMGSASGQVLFLFGGTSLLIAVVVAMDFVAQVQSYVMSKQYEQLMKRANLSGFADRNGL